MSVWQNFNMKAKLNINEEPNKKKFTKKSNTKKAHDVKSFENDTELEELTLIQNEIKSFLNNSQLTLSKTSKKFSKKPKNNVNNISDHKQLNQSKYAAKLMKKSKLKENNHDKKERKMKKIKAMKEKYSDMKEDVDISLDAQMKPVAEESPGKIKTVKEERETCDKRTKVLKGRISKKKEEKKQLYELERLSRKFDSISLNSSHDNNTLGKRQRNKSKKLLKKQRLLRKLLKEKNVTEPRVGKNRPSIETLKKQIECLKKEPESKKAKKIKLQSLCVKNNLMEVDQEKENEELKEKHKEDMNKEKKSKKNIKKSIIETGDFDNPVDEGLGKSKLKNAKAEKKNKKKKSKSKVENSDSENETPMKKKKPNQPNEELEDCDNNEDGSSHEMEAELSGGYREKYFKSKNTPLRERLMNKLKAARFRYLNEQMYTSKSGDSKQFFAQDPESFEAYHEGFKQQVAQWPINPVDVIIKSLQEKASRLIIADMGCGEAKLSASLEQHKVHSLDLVALNERVTPCDMTHTPLKSESVDVVVFCLSLMGTDLAACVKEANRILKTGGEMKIAEVESRFHDVKEFVKDIQKYGFESKDVNMDFSIFCFLDFKKVSNLSKTKKKKLPEIKLKPCLYKKR